MWSLGANGPWLGGTTRRKAARCSKAPTRIRIHLWRHARWLGSLRRGRRMRFGLPGFRRNMARPLVARDIKQAAVIDRPVLHMASPTHYANLMIRYMVAAKLAERLPGLQISAVDMPYWNIRHPTIDPRPCEKVCRITAEQHMAFDQIGYLWEKSLKTRFEWYGYGQRMENFPTKEICRQLFQADHSIGLSTSDNNIVCPIRGGEILQAIHPGYTTVPVNFYSDIIEEIGLDPIFMVRPATIPTCDDCAKDFLARSFCRT